MANSPVIPNAAQTLDWSWAGCGVVVMGLGSFGGNLAAIRWLVDQGAEVTVTDHADAGRLASSCQSIADLPVQLRLGGHDEGDLIGADLLVVSPAVNKRKSSFFQQALQRAIPWTSEMNLFIERCPARIVGVTGSAGKSTVCAMIHAICTTSIDRSDGPFHRVWLGGNIGNSLLPQCRTMLADDVVVLELSSYQLEDLADVDWFPEIAVLTGISSNHLARHGCIERYLDIKLDLLCAQGGKQAPTGQTRRRPVVVCMTEQKHVVDRIRQIAETTLATVHLTTAPKRFRSLRVPGKHNQRNAAGSAEVARLLGIASASVEAALCRFKGLPHRLEMIARIRGVAYLNDSKATTLLAATAALLAIDGPVVAIVGGQADSEQELPPGPFIDTLLDRVRAVVCTGSCGPQWAKSLRRAWGQRSASGPGVRPVVPPAVSEAVELGEAVRLAGQAAREGDTVLYAPGAPSYDQFSNYEARGEAFVRHVESLR